MQNEILNQTPMSAIVYMLLFFIIKLVLHNTKNTLLQSGI